MTLPVLMDVWQTFWRLMRQVAGINHVCDERVLVFLLILHVHRCVQIRVQRLNISISLSFGSIFDGQRLPIRVISQSQKLFYTWSD